MKQHQVIFTRTGSFGSVVDLAICSFESKEGDSFDILRKAITSWIDRTEEGRNAYEESVEDFNIGDLSCSQSPSLLEDYGVYNLEVETLEVGQCQDFDRHLYL